MSFELRRWLGPLGRYRPGLFRKNMMQGFRPDGGLRLPQWLPRCSSPEERLLESLDLGGKVVYDIGAHTGAYSLFFSRRVGAAGWVIAFEPQPRSFTKLARILQLNCVVNVRPLELALGAVQESRDLFMLPGMATTASVAHEAHTPLRRRAGRARVERLDDLVPRERLPPPDFVKIDVEGLELEVLQGAAATLARYRPDLLVEVHGTDRGLKTTRVRQLAQILRPLGYSLIHAESGQPITETCSAPITGHLFAQRAAA